MEDSVKKNSNLLKKYRIINQVTQKEMAKKIGVSRATLINYEKGHTSIPFDVIEKLKLEYPDTNNLSIEDKEEIVQPIINDGILDFKIVFKIIFKDRLFIFKWMLFLGFLGALASLQLTNYYSAGISLFPADNTSSGTDQLQSLALTAGINIGRSDQNYNITDVAKSRRIAEKVIVNKWENTVDGNQNLINYWNFEEKGYLSKLFKTTVSDENTLNSAIEKYFSLLSVNEDRRTGLIQVNIEMESPFLAAEIANFIGSQIQIYIQKQNSAQAAKEKLFISDRLVVVKSELEDLEDNLKNFKERNRGYEASAELFMKFSQKLREVEAKQQVYVTLQKQLELARINEVKQTPIINILDEAKPPVNKSRPSRAIIVLLSMFAGFIFSLSISIIKH
tara:strand:- start:14177 stop:15352 length:1176 start_codon:yes stop_codon:yes gene_type:complete